MQLSPLAIAVVQSHTREALSLDPKPCRLPVTTSPDGLWPLLSSGGRRTKSPRRAVGLCEIRPLQEARASGARHCTPRIRSLPCPAGRQHPVRRPQISEADQVSHLNGTGRNHSRTEPKPPTGLPQI